ncbi:MAG TPA: DUF445 domain-containing protein [Burkholderiales bacterium]|jgi:uncharacterized membrane-anchored protein YjiN (DUF445 family)|nr:DUF445 domain-containing protein [Burkholderiales bacterium]
MTKLQRMKWVATGLLVLAAVVYAVAQALEDRQPWLRYVAIAAEAAMVGAIADWFAVTALFHHPLGLRFIPHTAVIPRNKQRIAAGIAQFIEQNFLSAAAVVQRIREFRPARTLYGWLLAPGNAEAVAAYGARLAGYLLDALDDQRVRHFFQENFRRMAKGLDVAGAAAQVLDVLTENRRHHELLDAALKALDELLSREETRRFIAAEIARNAPLLKRFSDLFRLALDERAALKIVEVLIEKVGEVRAAEEHELRRRFDAYVAGFVQRLKADERLRARVEALRDEALASPALARYVGGLWDELRAWLKSDLTQQPSAVREKATQALRAIARSLEADEAMQRWIDERILAAAPALVDEHRAAIGRFVEEQILSWQERRLVEELERHLGADLQYIRVNGTVVGALAGLAIAIVTDLARLLPA